MFGQLSIIYLSSLNRETIFTNVVNREYKANELKAVCLNKLSLKTSSKMKAIHGLYMHFTTAMAEFPAMVYEPALPVTLPVKKKKAIMPIYDLSDDTEEDTVEECAICFDNINSSDRVILNCNHQFCGVCINDYIKKYHNEIELSCALCRTKITTVSVKNAETYNAIFAHCTL
jgi:hypothetical protein